MERRIAPTAIRCPRVVCLLMPSLPSTKMAVLNASSSGYWPSGDRSSLLTTRGPISTTASGHGGHIFIYPIISGRNPRASKVSYRLRSSLLLPSPGSSLPCKFGIHPYSSLSVAALLFMYNKQHLFMNNYCKPEQCPPTQQILKQTRQDNNQPTWGHGRINFH